MDTNITTTLSTVIIDNITIIECKDTAVNLTNFWLYGIMLNTIGSFGIIGHTLSIIILSRPEMQSNFNFLLISLSICDTTLIISSMLTFGLKNIYESSKPLYFYHYYICPYIYPYTFALTSAAQTASIYLTLIISFERYVAVCYPLHLKTLCTKRRTKLYIFLCIIFAITFNFLRIWEHQLVECYNNSFHAIAFSWKFTKLRNSDKYQKIY